MTLLECSQLSYEVNHHSLLNAISCSVQKGEIVGLIGPNGAGKSTLLKLLARILNPASGNITLEDKNAERFSARDYARRVSYLAQASSIHWPITVERLVALGRLPWAEITGMNKKAAVTGNHQDESAIESAIGLCELAPFRHRPVDSLSAGEQARANLARALASQPKLLLADEPAAALDPRHQILLMDILKTLSQSTSPCSTLIVMHDLNLAARWCDRLILLDKGHIIAEGKPELVLNADVLSQTYQVGVNVYSSDEGEREEGKKGEGIRLAFTNRKS